MTKKNDKRLCWNCDGGVSPHISQCPYCGVDLRRYPERNEESTPFSGFASPFQNSAPVDESVPQPPYSSFFNQQTAVNEEEWNQALGEETELEDHAKEHAATTSKREMVALLLLLPGVVFFLFALALFLFSSGGVLTLKWDQHFAYFYFLGAIPLLCLGWRALR